MKLTNTAVKNASATGKQRKLSDGKGLFLLVTAAGKKYWRLKYRFNGKEKLLALGVYPELSLKEAREGTEQARKLLANGIDPSEYKQQTKHQNLEEAANTFQAIATEWFLTKSPSWSDSHRSRTKRLLERDLYPWLASRPITAIEAPELLRTAKRIVDRGAIETAHRAVGIAGQVFRYAVATGKTNRDPSGDLRGALPPAKKTHFAAATEPAELAHLLKQFEGYHGTPAVRVGLQLTPMLFVRPGELRQAKWADIDLEAGEWRYLVTKTESQHIVPLPTQAVALLSELKPLTGQYSEYVFPSPRSHKRPMSDNALLSAMRRMGIEKDETSLHGFRATARTILDEVLGFRPDYLEHQLAHQVKDPNGRAYNRTAHLAERKKMMQAWADYLDQLKTDGNVIPLHTKRQA